MSDKKLTRRAHTEISFDGTDITASVRPYFLSLTYTDNEADEADDLQIRLQDKDQTWMEQWLNEIVDAAASDTLTLESSGTYTVTAKSGLNVRAGPGTDSKKLGALPCGEEIQVSSVSDGWAVVSYGGGSAYVSAAYLKQKGSDTPAGNAGTGLAIECVIVRENWTGDGKDDYLNCGSFELDTVEASGPPSVITIKATSLPFKHRIRQTKQSRAWEEYCLSGIAFEMARKNGMVCMFLPANDPYYPRVEQYETSDVEFLSGLCRDAGISLKVTNKTLVLFDQKEYESRDAVQTFRKGDGHYINYRLSVSAADTQYQSCRVSYNDPETGKSIEGVAYADDYDKDSDKNQQLEETRKVSSIGEAETLAAKLLRLHNKYERTARFVCPGNPFLTSGSTIQLDGWGAWEGKYIITQSSHSVGSSGYTTTIEARRTLDGY